MMDRKIKPNGRGSQEIFVLFQIRKAATKKIPASALIGSDFIHMRNGFLPVMPPFRFKYLKICSKEQIACQPPKYKAKAGSKGRNTDMRRINRRLENLAIGISI